MTNWAALAPVTAQDLEPLDGSARELAVTRYLTDARDRLAVALEVTGPHAVAALKAEIATAAEATKQLGLSREIQTDAQEMVRRAEFALGKAIRAGQEAGEITSRENNDSGPRGPYVRERAGVVEYIEPESREATSGLNRPTDFAKKGELVGDEGIYALVDGVKESEFEAALSDAKAEGNVSRANVVRKIKGVKTDGLTPVEKLVKIRELAAKAWTSDQIATEIGCTQDYVRERAREVGIEIPADKLLRGTQRKVDHTRFVNETVIALEGLASGLDVLDLTKVDLSQAEFWASSLTDSLRALNRLANKIKELTHEH